MEAEHQQVEQLRSQLQQLVECHAAGQRRHAKGADHNGPSSSTATQAQKDAAEAQRSADQASENARGGKTGLALIKTSEADNIKRLGTPGGITSRFRWNGDIRLRGENYQQPLRACVDRKPRSRSCAPWAGRETR